MTFIDKLHPSHITHKLWLVVFGQPACFVWNDEKTPMFYHPYNATWSNERRVEIPIVMKFLDGVKQADILEVGNVLPHYFPSSHAVVDFFEKGDNVVNVDIETFVPAKRFKAVVSISTLEHVGVDSLLDEGKAIRVLNLLARYGDNVLCTWLLGYNKNLDAYALRSSCATKLVVDKKRSIIVWQHNT